MLVVFLEKQKENSVIRLPLQSLFSGKIAFFGPILGYLMKSDHFGFEDYVVA